MQTEGDDNITLSNYYASTAYIGDGKDTIIVNNPNTTLHLSEIKKQDTVIIPSSITNESGITKIIDFDLTGSKINFTKWYFISSFNYNSKKIQKRGKWDRCRNYKITHY